MSITALSKPLVLIVGDLSHPDVAAVAVPLEDSAVARHYASMQEAAEWLSQAEVMPDVVLLVQARPGEIASSSVDQLRRLAPLVPMLAILGSCCEGETRTGTPWPGVPRCYWYQWPARWREEQLRRRAGELPLWSLPATASEEERLLARMGRAESSRAISISVVAPASDATNALADALQSVGCSVALSAPSENPSIVLWDTSPASVCDPQQVSALRLRYGAAPILALVTFPRHQTTAAARQAGVAALLAKPFLLDDLIAEIDCLS